MPPSENAPLRLRDVGWTMVVAACGLGVVAYSVATVVCLVIGPRGLTTVMQVGWIVTLWWTAQGAWLRTRWGRAALCTPPPWVEPPLTARRAWWLVWVGAACVVAVSLAIGVQARSWVG